MALGDGMESARAVDSCWPPWSWPQHLLTHRVQACVIPIFNSSPQIFHVYDPVFTSGCLRRPVQ